MIESTPKSLCFISTLSLSTNIGRVSDFTVDPIIILSTSLTSNDLSLIVYKSVYLLIVVSCLYVFDILRLILKTLFLI